MPKYNSSKMYYTFRNQLRYQEQEKLDQSHEIAQLQSDLSDLRRDNYNLRQNYDSVKRNLDRLQEVRELQPHTEL